MLAEGKRKRIRHEDEYRMSCSLAAPQQYLFKHPSRSGLQNDDVQQNCEFERLGPLHRETEIKYATVEVQTQFSSLLSFVRLVTVVALMLHHSF